MLCIDFGIEKCVNLSNSKDLKVSKMIHDLRNPLFSIKTAIKPLPNIKSHNLSRLSVVDSKNLLDTTYNSLDPKDSSFPKNDQSINNNNEIKIFKEI